MLLYWGTGVMWLGGGLGLKVKTIAFPNQSVDPPWQGEDSLRNPF